MKLLRFDYMILKVDPTASSSSSTESVPPVDLNISVSGSTIYLSQTRYLGAIVSVGFLQC